MKLQRVLLWLMIAGLSLSMLPAGAAQAQQGAGERYFDETGHRVSGAFYQYYTAFTEPEFVFGYPITEAYTDPKSGRLVQYFQRARFEFYPERPVGEQVQPTPLGSLLYSPGPALPQNNLLGCHTFPQTGFAVCYAFLEFFDKYGGEAAFGPPISGFEIYNGRIVQYFERARFEWYPELQEGQKVVLANLGRIYFDQTGEDPALLKPVILTFSPASVRALKLRLYTWRTAVRPGDEQRIYVVLQDQALRPIPDVEGLVTIHWSGAAQTYRFTTDKDGVAILTVDVPSQRFGRAVSVTADVVWGNLSSRAATSFRIWR
ncbi:MAG: hypothetical protein WHV44_16025 [Anaerolineales bacterium]